MKYEDIVRNEEILAYYERGCAILDVLGYTDHSTIHTRVVAEKAADILKSFGYGEELIELAKIAGFMHDIGNAINRHHHAEYKLRDGLPSAAGGERHPPYGICPSRRCLFTEALVPG